MVAIYRDLHYRILKKQAVDKMLVVDLTGAVEWCPFCMAFRVWIPK